MRKQLAAAALLLLPLTCAAGILGTSAKDGGAGGGAVPLQPVIAAPLQELSQLGKPDAARMAVKTQAVAPDLFLVYPVATAEPGQAGWVSMDAIVVDKRKAIWLKRSVDLEAAPSKECPYYVQLDTDGWTLWLLSGHTKLRVTGDATLVALMPDLIPVRGLRKKLTE